MESFIGTYQSRISVAGSGKKTSAIVIPVGLSSATPVTSLTGPASNWSSMWVLSIRWPSSTTLRSWISTKTGPKPSPWELAAHLKKSVILTHHQWLSRNPAHLHLNPNLKLNLRSTNAQFVTKLWLFLLSFFTLLNTTFHNFWPRPKCPWKRLLSALDARILPTVTGPCWSTFWSSISSWKPWRKSWRIRRNIQLQWR